MNPIKDQIEPSTSGKNVLTTPKTGLQPLENGCNSAEVSALIAQTNLDCSVTVTPNKVENEVTSSTNQIKRRKSRRSSIGCNYYGPIKRNNAVIASKRSSSCANRDKSQEASKKRFNQQLDPVANLDGKFSVPIFENLAPSANLSAFPAS